MTPDAASRPELPQLASADHAGVLHKRGHRNTTFRRRYFVLRAKRLTYFEDEQAAARGRSRGSVTVSRVRHLRSGETEPLVHEDGLPASHLPFAFHFETAERKPFYVYAESMSAKLGWLRSLHLASGAAVAAAPSACPSACANADTPWATHTAVEDVYREHVSASQAGLDATLTAPLAWRCIANGVAHARAGRAVEAEAEFESALAHARADGGGGSGACTEPAVLAALHESGKLHCLHARHDEAKRRFEHAASVAPPEAARPLRLRVAWCCWQLGDRAHAEQLYSRLLDEQPLCAHSLLDRARMHVAVRHWAHARADLELVLAMGCREADVLNDLGVCYYELREPRAALTSLTRAVEAAAAAGDARLHAMALGNRGNAHRALKQPEEAMADYELAVERDATSAAARSNRGALCLDQGAAQLGAAQADFEAALRLDSAHETAARNLEVVRRRQLVAAAAEAQAAVEVVPVPVG